jgi:hypothetical protein
MRGPFDDFTPIELEFLKDYRALMADIWACWNAEFIPLRDRSKKRRGRFPKGFTGGKKVLSGDGSPQD